MEENEVFHKFGPSFENICVNEGFLRANVSLKK